jgi:hypothetical protein
VRKFDYHPADPIPVQPLEHQQRRGHLLRRGQLHEPARRGYRSFTLHPAGIPQLRGHGRGVHRQRRPRSWR